MSQKLFNSNMYLNVIVDLLVQNYKNKVREKYRFPSQISTAKVHVNAAKFGYNPEIENKSQEMRCACCNLIIGTEKIGICYNTTTFPDSGKQFALSSSVSLFFYFIKIIIIFLICKLLITDLYNIYTSIVYGSYCKNNTNDCYMSIWTMTSGLNKRQDTEIELIVLDILNLLFILFSIGFFIVFRDMMENHYNHIDEHLETEDDYAIFIEGMSLINEKDLNNNLLLSSKIDFYFEVQKFFEGIIMQWLQDYDHFPQLDNIQKQFHMLTTKKGKSHEIVKSISLCYDLTELNRLNELRDKMMQYHQSFMRDKSQLLQCVQMQTLNDVQLELSKKFASQRSLNFKLTHFVNCAIVCFEYQHYKDYIVQKAKNNSLIFKGSPIKIQPASNPRDIHWYNLSVLQGTRQKNIYMSYFFMTVCLVFSFLLVSLIEIQKYKFSEYFQISQAQAFTMNYKKVLIYCLTYLANGITLAINSGLYYLAVYLNKLECHKTRTKENSHLIGKLLISQFLNYAILYSIIYVFLPYDNLSDLGLIFTLSNLIFFSGIVQSFLNLINLPDCYRRFIIFWKYRKVRDNDPLPYFQINLNRQLEFVDFDLASRYTYYIVQIYTIMLYSYAIPMASFIYIIVLFLQYWLDKFNLFKRSSLKQNLGLFITKSLFKYLEYSILIFAFGNVIFAYITTNVWSILNIIGLVIVLLYLILRFGCIDWKRIRSSQFETISEYTYTESVNEGKFKYTFWLSNPATQLVEQSAMTGHFNTSQKSLKNSIIFNPRFTLRKSVSSVMSQKLI